jgi:hypothetical protein
MAVAIRGSARLYTGKKHDHRLSDREIVRRGFLEIFSNYCSAALASIGPGRVVGIS